MILLFLVITVRFHAIRRDSCGGGGKTWKVSQTFQVSLDSLGGAGRNLEGA